MEEKFPTIVEQPVFWGPEKSLHSASRNKAITDANTGKLFSIVSSSYKPIRHEAAIDQVESAIADTPDLGEYEVKTDLDNDGGRMRRVYRFADKWLEIAPDDPVNLELHLFNSYDLSWPFMITLGAFRFVCGNGLVVGKDLLYFKRRHVYTLEALNVEQEVSTAFQRFEQQGNRWKMWTRMHLTPGIAEKIINQMDLGKNAAEMIENKIIQEAEDFDDKNFPIITLWAFYNVFTWYISYKAVSINHRVQLEKRLRVAMKGLR